MTCCSAASLQYVISHHTNEVFSSTHIYISYLNIFFLVGAIFLNVAVYIFIVPINVNFYCKFCVAMKPSQHICMSIC